MIVRRNMRCEMASEDLSCDGIEIGALLMALPVPRAAHVTCVDRLDVTARHGRHSERKGGRLAEVDIISDGETLANIPDGSQDFLFANHFLEHSTNPIGAIQNMLRALGDGAVLRFPVPDKRLALDVRRPVTPFEHLLEHYRSGPEIPDTDDYQKCVRFVDKPPSEASTDERTAFQLEPSCKTHCHIWKEAGSL